MAKTGLNIAFIPIDNRPVCYTLAQQIAEINPEINLFLPDRSFLGDLKKTADVDAILEWVIGLENIDKIVVSLDTIAYGGLVPSRRSFDSFEEIKSRVEKLKSILKSKGVQIYAFSSVMRISNNNVNEEEKEYWNLYGKDIFKYSYEFHKNCVAETDVPEEIIKDYLKTRKRNFEINKLYLDWAKEKFFKTLVFSKDDCAQYGLNVKEAQDLGLEIEKHALPVLLKTGADEIPLSLLSRALTDGTEVKIAPIFTEKEFTNKISKYEDISVFESVKGQIELAGAQVCDEASADIILVVNNFKEEQGELVMGVDVEGFTESFMHPKKPYLIADVRNANGSDNNFVESFLKQDINWAKFLGYAAWNTTGNTLGSALCCALVKFLAEEPNLANFKQLQTIRFLDDWAYQANVRKVLKSYLSEISLSELKNKMVDYEKFLNAKFETDFKCVKYDYPWSRFFEIEINF